MSTTPYRWTPVPIADDESEPTKVTSWAIQEDRLDDKETEFVLGGMTWRRAVAVAEAHNKALAAFDRSRPPEPEGRRKAK